MTLPKLTRTMRRGLFDVSSCSRTMANDLAEQCDDESIQRQARQMMRECDWIDQVIQQNGGVPLPKVTKTKRTTESNNADNAPEEV